MILGDCPYCNDQIALAMPDRPMPAIAKIPCDHCGEFFWQRFSRFDPECWTLKEFADEFDFKSIKICPII